MRKLMYILAFSILLSSLGRCMSLEELDANLESGNNSDFIKACTYVERVIRGSVKLEPEKKIAIAKVLYKYRNEADQTVLEHEGSDMLYGRGRGWIVSRMARLTSYIDHLPDEVKNQTTPGGSVIDPIGPLICDPAQQEKFLKWFEAGFHEKEGLSDGKEDPKDAADHQIEKSNQKPDSRKWMWISTVGLAVCGVAILIGLLRKRDPK